MLADGNGTHEKFTKKQRVGSGVFKWFTFGNIYLQSSAFLDGYVVDESVSVDSDSSPKAGSS